MLRNDKHKSMTTSARRQKEHQPEWVEGVVNTIERPAYMYPVTEEIRNNTYKLMQRQMEKWCNCELGQ